MAPKLLTKSDICNELNCTQDILDGLIERVRNTMGQRKFGGSKLLNKDRATFDPDGVYVKKLWRLVGSVPLLDAVSKNKRKHIKKRIVALAQISQSAKNRSAKTQRRRQRSAADTGSSGNVSASARIGEDVPEVDEHEGGGDFEDIQGGEDHAAKEGAAPEEDAVPKEGAVQEEDVVPKEVVSAVYEDEIVIAGLTSLRDHSYAAMARRNRQSMATYQSLARQEQDADEKLRLTDQIIHHALLSERLSDARVQTSTWFRQVLMGTMMRRFPSPPQLSDHPNSACSTAKDRIIDSTCQCNMWWICALIREGDPKLPMKALQQRFSRIVVEHEDHAPAAREMLEVLANLNVESDRPGGLLFR